MRCSCRRHRWRWRTICCAGGWGRDEAESPKASRRVVDRYGPEDRRRHGEGYPQLVSLRDAIRRYLVSCTCVGIDVETGEVCAPYGFDELGQGLLRMNPVNPRPEHFRAKAASYIARWPWLRMVD